MCNEVIDCYNEGTNFNEKETTCKNAKFLYFICIFINYYSVIDSCCYLLLFDKISGKTKTLIVISLHR